ncbi:hypothetical protein PA25_27870 [Pseudoalteromonas sp. A25]|nr:hypothetical protein PA25_27870 [Pseudoalteromonas sp. A25]
MGGVATAGIMLCIITKEVLLKGLHAALCVIALLLLLSNVPVAMFLFAVILVVYLTYSFSFSALWLSKLVAGSIALYVVFLSGYLLFQWPINNAAFALLFVYFGLLYATWIEAQNKQQPVTNEHKQFAHELGIPGRASLRCAYEEQRKLDPGPAILVLVFLEGIEQVNMQLGREFGDTLLAESANRVQQQLNNRDIFTIPNGNSVSRLAHLGGLHFAFICRLGRFEYLHEQLIDDILLCVAKPFQVGSCTLEISARVSFVNCDEELGQLDSLIACAYLALDKLPNQSICAYQQQMQISQIEQQTRLRELANIKVDQDLAIFFQPAFSQQNGKLAYLELLLRWPHPKLGLLSAERFIEDIRLAGLALPVARFVIERAAEIAMALKMEGFQVPLSINIFGSEMLQQDFIRFMDHILLEHYLQAGDILLEFPANLLPRLDYQSLDNIDQLRRLGIHIGIDRFGQAPIQLDTLSELQVDFIKLSSSLTAQPQPNGARAVCQSLVSMQQQRGLKVFCEGIESKAQFEYAKELECDAMQGHFLAQPMSSKGVMGWLHKWTSDNSN